MSPVKKKEARGPGDNCFTCQEHTKIQERVDEKVMAGKVGRKELESKRRKAGKKLPNPAACAGPQQGGWADCSAAQRLWSMSRVTSAGF